MICGYGSLKEVAVTLAYPSLSMMCLLKHTFSTMIDDRRERLGTGS